MTPAPNKDAVATSANRRIDVGAVNQAVLAALLTRNWPELDRLVPRQRVQDPSPEVQDVLFRVE